MATMNSSQTVYAGPGNSFKNIGSVNQNEQVTYCWTESSNWVYIEYSVSGTGLKKRGYVPKEAVNGAGNTNFTPDLSSSSTRYVRKGCIPFFGPNNRGYDLDVTNYGISRGETVKFTGKKINDYAFVQYGNRRFWVLASNLMTGVPTAEDATTLTFNYHFVQTGTDWNYLNPDFHDKGCAICCAADVASYVEGTSLNPEVMRNRGVFTYSNIACNFNNASDDCVWISLEQVPANSYLQAINHYINSGLPVIVKVSRTGSNDHWVVAYGYENGAATPNDILVCDPNVTNRTRLSHALESKDYEGLKFIKMK